MCIRLGIVTNKIRKEGGEGIKSPEVTLDQ